LLFDALDVLDIDGEIYSTLNILLYCIKRLAFDQIFKELGAKPINVEPLKLKRWEAEAQIELRHDSTPERREVY
jgi:hypothetical protein